jgi:glucose/arabinose dehydrogenase
MMRQLTLTSVGTLVLCAVLIGQQRPPQLPAPSQARPNPGRVIPRPENAQLKVPDGFTVSIFADDVQSARMMEYAPNGDLFVSQTGANAVVVLRDTNNDGTPDMRSVFIQGPPPPARRGGPPPAAATGAPGAGRGPGAGAPAAAGAAPGGPPAGAPPAGGPPAGIPPPGAAQGRGGPPAPPVCTGDTVGGRQPLGLTFQPGYLYVGYTDCIVRYKYQPGDTQASQPERLVDLPGGGNHFARNVTFSRDGKKMYVTVGSGSNNSEGEDVRRAAISEYNADGTGFRIFASGLRNPTALAWQPGTNTLWTSVNERDNLGDDLVPDYFTSVKEGGFYGWPFSYIGQNYDPLHVGKLPNLVKTAIIPDVLLGAHSAALGATFYTGTQFPQRYRNGAFVAMHGSWNRSKANGYKVGFVPFQNGKPGPVEDFLTGFLVNDGSDGQITSWGRPVGVTVARDGSLLVSDDGGNRIWKISYSAARK